MKLLTAILMLFVSTALYAFPSGYGTRTVYNAFLRGEKMITDVEDRATILEGRATLLEDGTLKYKSFTLNVTATLAAAATVVFVEAQLPAGAVIVKSFAQVETQVVSADDNTIALACGSAAILAATDLTDTAAGFIALAITDVATTYKAVGAAVCSPTVTIGAGASGVTAGKVKFTVAYIL